MKSGFWQIQIADMDRYEVTYALPFEKKNVSENFDFHVTLRHHQSYKLAEKYTFFSSNDNTTELLTKILQNI
jgi:uncharacterized protein YajQ (UPF0234 family)